MKHYFSCFLSILIRTICIELNTFSSTSGTFYLKQIEGNENIFYWWSLIDYTPSTNTADMDILLYL